MYPESSPARRAGVIVVAALVAVATVLVIAGGGAASSAEQTWGPRDPWLRPYDANSIWNTPIGSNAKFVPTGYPRYERGGADPAHLVRTTWSDPMVPTRQPHHWRDRCNAAAPQTGEIRLPRDFFVPDAVQGPNGSWKTPNDNGVVLDPDGRTLRSISTSCRDRLDGPLHAWTAHTTDLYGDGRKGSHGASQMSVLGGAIRDGELTGDLPIAHALSLVLYTKTAYMQGNDRSTCYRWPASGCDAYAGRAGDPRYSGNNPDFRIGALLAIPSNISCDSLGLESPEGAKLCWTMQHYGGYWTEDSAWEANYVVVEEHTEDRQRFSRDPVRRDLGRVIAAAQVVSNNSPDNIGGGGAPLAPRHVNSWTVGARGTETGGFARTGANASLDRMRANDPSRLFDSRGGGARPADSVTAVDVAGAAEVPADAAAVVLNVTVVEAQAAGFVTVFSCGQPIPVASNVNYSAGQTIANSVIAKPGDDGRVCVYTSADAHLLVDVAGSVPAGSTLTPTEPVRIHESRPTSVLGAGTVTAIGVAGSGTVPADAVTVVLNVTVVEPRVAGFVTVFSCGQPVPGRSNVNFSAGQTIANSVVAAPGDNGQVCVYTSVDTHLLVDQNGFVR